MCLIGNYSRTWFIEIVDVGKNSMNFVIFENLLYSAI